MSSCRVGFLIDGLVPSWHGLLHGHCGPREILLGMPGSTAIGVMRFGWVAQWVNSSENEQSDDGKVTYELYRPWRRYQLVVILKSLNERSITLRNTLAAKGVKTIFDLNVDYLSQAEGVFFYEGMAPTPEQNVAARFLAAACDGVIADSTHLAAIAAGYNEHVACIPDNVRDDLIGNGSTWRPAPERKLPLVWCGQHVKLFELLLVREVLTAFADRVQLRLITNGRGSHPAWDEQCKAGLDQLLGRVEHEFITFHSVESLMQEYDRGGVFIAPRYLDNSYNLGHTEWKISLPMARGRFVLCSPQPSYLELAEKAGHRGIRVCRSEADWCEALEQALSGALDWPGEQKAASDVVRRCYATSLVAAKHLGFVRRIMRG